MLRRAAIRNLFGAGLGAALVRKAEPVAAQPTYTHVPPLGLPAQGSPEVEKKWRLFNLNARERAEQEELDEIRRRLLGEWPPQVASCHSWAPWFRATVAARHIRDRRRAHRSWEDQLRAKIFGEDA